MLAIACSLAVAIAKVGDDTASLEVNGNLRLLGGYLHFFRAPAYDDGIGAAVGRILLNGRIPWEIDYDANLFIDLQRGPTSANANAFSTAATFVTPYRTRYLQWNFWQNGSVSGSMGVDRLRLHKSFGWFDVDIGRFPVNHSVTFLFTPNDFFAPFSATTLNRQYKPGVDALRLRFGLGALSNLEVLAVAGPTFEKTALMLRVDTTLWGFQWAATGGKLAERYVVGGSMQGDIEGVVLRAEGHAGFPDRGRNDDRIHGRAAARIEYTWSWHNTSVGGEYAFFSDGAAGPSGYAESYLRFFPDDLPFAGRHYAAINAGMELIPILTVAAFTMVNIQDGSGLASASLSYNASNEIDVVGGGMAGWGRTISELGNSPLVIFIEMRASF